MKMLKVILISLQIANICIADEKLNIANPEHHPYIKAEDGREVKDRYNSATVNESRIYNFYQRQADYYMANPPKDKILPAFPGLDAGLFGHWGRHNQNSHKDDRWNQVIHDDIISSHTVFPQETGIATVEHGLILKLSQEGDLHGVFSPLTGQFLYFWKGSGISYNPFRWGCSRGATPVGEGLVATKQGVVKHSVNYKGYYKHGQRFIISYDLNDISLLDSAYQVKNSKVLKRLIEFQNSAASLEIPIATDEAITEISKNHYSLANGSQLLLSSTGAEFEVLKTTKSLIVKFKNLKANSQFQYYIIPKGESADNIKEPKLTFKKLIQEGGVSTIGSDTYTTSVSNAASNAAYVVDDFEIPFENKTKSLMFFTGIDFDAKGTAYITTMKGELWKVKGLAEGKVTWRKIASGLNQPFGIKLKDNVIYVLERSQLSALHDTNDDEEIDFVECINNELVRIPKSHSHNFGLDLDSKGNFLFTNVTVAQKINLKTRKLTLLATGLRNCMGTGIYKDFLLAGPQEGTQTPASAIFKVKQGEHYGLGKSKLPLTPPMAYVPRAIDNSTGGFLHLNDKRWGPLGQSLIGLSYGYGKWYQIMIDQNGNEEQAATVPMDGQFLSGVVRAAVNPVDGQVYTVGLDGWGDYSVKDGCLHRIRYTGKKLYKPVSYKTFFNGIRVEFPVELDKDYVENAKSYFAQHWNYLLSKQYGSPEYSVSKPEKLGHDVLSISSVKLMDDKKSIFVEIPNLVPVMQMHLRMHLKAQDGTLFKTDIFPTIKTLGSFYEFKNAQVQNTEKKTEFTLIQKVEKKSSKHTKSGKVDDHARTITMETLNLKYSLSSFKVKAGESIQLKLINKDAMPHNLVITQQGAYKKVGEASFKMLNNPKAAEMHYVPKMPEVIAYTHVIPANGSHKLYFKAPEKKGSYPFFCSFPGHWMLMKGEMIVE